MEKTMPVFDGARSQLLESMPYQYEGKDIDIRIETAEFTCLCPWTGLPDFALLKISYVPAKNVVELKSLKMYLQSFRMTGIVHESAVNKISEDLIAKIKPQKLIVEMEFGIRGGLKTTVKREYRHD
jgi:7-cyano-7-deazaguanine reductase